MKDLLPHHIYVDVSAQSINRLGNIAGWVNTATNSYPALWTAGSLKVLSTLGGPNAIAIAINGKNQMVGYSGTTAGANHAFFWDQTGGMTDLGTLGGINSEAFGVNSAGQVVGYSELP
jgi:probable HAF family extracellular repeat protein